MGDTEQSLGVEKSPKALLLIALVAVGLVLMWVVGIPMLMHMSLSRSGQKTYEAIQKVSLPCPSGTTQIIESWSEAGFSVSCRKGEINHGPWQAWASGRLEIEGEFFEGREAGTWLYYSADGKIAQTFKKAAK